MNSLTALPGNCLDENDNADSHNCRRYRRGNCHLGSPFEIKKLVFYHSQNFNWAGLNGREERMLFLWDVSGAISPKVKSYRHEN